MSGFFVRRGITPVFSRGRSLIFCTRVKHSRHCEIVIVLHAEGSLSTRYFSLNRLLYRQLYIFVSTNVWILCNGVFLEKNFFKIENICVHLLYYIYIYIAIILYSCFSTLHSPLLYELQTLISVISHPPVNLTARHEFPSHKQQPDIQFCSDFWVIDLPN